MPRVLLFGSPPFAEPIRTALAERGWLAGIVTRPPKPQGRGRRVASLPAGWMPDDATVFAPAEPTKDALARAAAAVFADVAVLASYGRILSPDALAALPRHRVNVHPSLLPRWRGAAPIPRTILAGDAETGVTLHEPTATVDAGPIIAVERVELDGSETTVSLTTTLSRVAGNLLVRILPEFAAGKLPRRTQPKAGATPAPRVRLDEAWLDWSKDATMLERTVRAFDPWPVARTILDGTPLLIYSARIHPSRSNDVFGTLRSLDRGLVVACGSGTLELTRVQRPGRAVMDSSAFLTGYRGKLPAVLSSPVGTSA